MNLTSFMIYVLAIFAIVPVFTYVIYSKLGLGLNIFGIFENCNGNCVCDPKESPVCGDCIYDFSNPETCKNIKAVLWAKKNLCYHVICYEICERSYDDIVSYYRVEGEKELYEDALKKFNESHCCLLLGRYPAFLRNEYYCDNSGYLRKISR